MICAFSGHKEQQGYQGRATNRAGACCPVHTGTWLRGGARSPIPALLTRQFALVWHCISREKGLSFSNWHKGTIWVSGNPFQTLGVSALWPSFQGLSSPSLFQPLGICSNKYLLSTYFVSASTGFTLMNKRASCFHAAYSLVEVIPSFFLHDIQRAYSGGSLSWSQPLFSKTWVVGTWLENHSWGWEIMTTTPTHMHLSPDLQGDGTVRLWTVISSVASFTPIRRRKKNWHYGFHWKSVRFILRT